MLSKSYLLACQYLLEKKVNQRQLKAIKNSLLILAYMSNFSLV